MPAGIAITLPAKLMARFWKLWNPMAPVTGISPIVFYRYNDYLRTFDYVINGVRETWHSADPNSRFDFSELGRSVPNFFNSSFDRSEESFRSLPIKVNCIAILFASLRNVSVFH